MASLSLLIPTSKVSPFLFFSIYCLLVQWPTKMLCFMTPMIVLSCPVLWGWSGSIIVGSLKQIFKQEGTRGLYRGLSPTVMALLSNWAVSEFNFFLYLFWSWRNLSRFSCSKQLVTFLFFGRFILQCMTSSRAFQSQMVSPKKHFFIASLASVFLVHSFNNGVNILYF